MKIRKERDGIMGRRKCFSIYIVFAILVSIIILSVTLKTDAKEKNNDRIKYYTSILIEEGDSLWSIAEEYRPDDNISVKKYIKDLKKMNNMHSDTIHAGNYLTIYYYND